MFWLKKDWFAKNRTGFKGLINEIIEYLPQKLRDTILDGEIDFAGRIRDNRNYYTHYSDKYKAKAISLSELFILSEKLKIILMVAVLKEISFTNEQLEKIIFTKGLFRFNHIIKRQLN